MRDLQYDRQQLYYKWALILCIIGYPLYYFYNIYSNHIGFVEKSLYTRIGIIIYFILLLLFINKIHKKFQHNLGFLIALPAGWSGSLIAYYTTGYEGNSVTAFIFILFLAAIILDFKIYSYLLVLSLILIFHFTLLSWYPTDQTEAFRSHLFLLGLTGLIGLTTNLMINKIKTNESNVLAEREILIKEINHRVKNNLQVISSLLDLQSGSIQDENIKTMVKEGQSRVKSMALIHQLLYQTDAYTSIDFSKYLKQLMDSLNSSFYKHGKTILFTIHAEKIELDIDTSVALGLITNELATNAYKYAFADRSEGNIILNFKDSGDNHIVLTIQDDGQGLPEDFDFENAQTLGLKLVKLLVRQLKAELKYEVNGGTKFKIIIPRVL